MATLTRGERFKDARTEFNRNGKQTLREVEQATGVNKAKIQALEDDENNRSVGYEDVATLAKHYGVTADFLLGLTDDPAIHSRTLDELGLSAMAAREICFSRKVDIGAIGVDCMPTLNAMLESGRFHALVMDMHFLIRAAEARSIYRREWASMPEGKFHMPNRNDLSQRLQSLAENIDDPVTARSLMNMSAMEQADFGICHHKQPHYNPPSCDSIVNIHKLQVQEDLTSLINFLCNEYE